VTCEMLMAVAFGRYAPNGSLVEGQLVALMEAELVVKTEDGWKVTQAGFDYLEGEGWLQRWCRFTPFDDSMRPGIFDTADEAREYDDMWRDRSHAERALIKPVFVNREREELVS